MENSDTASTVRILIISSFALLGIVALGVIGTACYIMAIGRDLPQALSVLLTAVVTYLFTTLAGMVRDYTGKTNVKLPDNQ
jgi:hypothetical protein